MRSPSLSVVLITYERREMARRCLESLDQQTVKDFEVVVVVDGSTDGTAEMARTFRPSGFTIKVIDKPNEGRSLSRNLGAKNANSDLLVFFDDDMTPFPGCLQTHLEMLANNPGVISVGTQEEDPSKIVNDFDAYRRDISLRWERSVTGNQHTMPYLTAANVCIPKGLFLELNGFDKNTEVMEDFDLGLRATVKGVKVLFNPGARAIHNDRVNCVTFIRKQIEYDRSFLNIMTLRRDILPDYQGFKVYKPGPLKRSVYFLISFQFVAILIDKNFFRFLPRRLRFRLFDMFITGLSKVYPSRFTMQPVKYHG